MKGTRQFVLLLTCIAVIAAIASCASQRKLKKINTEKISTTIGLPKEKQFQTPEIKNTQKKDTLKIVDFEGKEMFVMKAIKDEDGNDVANQVLDAAVVTARFRHLAERNGKVDIEFQIIVPEALQDGAWQLRYQPTMYVLGDSVKLDKVFITGNDYRKRQMRGYQQYDRFLKRIITDSTKLIDIDRLEIFLERNIPQVYAFKTDTSFVSDEQFAGFMGVTEREAIDHYTKKFIIKRNARLMKMREKKYRQYVKAPLIRNGIRLDTVMRSITGNYVYNYVQELDLKGKKKLKKVDVVLDGEIFEQGTCIHKIDRTEPLTFYISSLSAFVDGTERYITKIVERRLAANQEYNIDFNVGKSDIVPDLGNNTENIDLIKRQLRVLLDNKVFDLDSVTVVASASPEGSVQANGTLAKKRSESISAFFNKFMRQQIDSLNAEDGISFNLDDSYQTQKKEARKPITFKSRYIAEDWDRLYWLVGTDSTFSVTDKEEYYALCDINNPDEREQRMKTEKWYKYMKEKLYPKLRTVRFEFALHRKGMVKDTMHTTVIDSVYMSGIQAIRDRDYELAANILGPYNDYNAAIAYSALDRNYSALQILEKCEKTAEVNYMMAILYSRFGDEEKAVQSYLLSCHQNGQYVHRGNLDPEISVLIKKYELNKQDDSDLY